jgi:hypothetical protein
MPEARFKAMQSSKSNAPRQASTHENLKSRARDEFFSREMAVSHEASLEK